MNEVTQKAFEAIKKATTDSCSGIADGGPFRMLWEPTEGNNNFKELGELLTRTELEQAYLQEVSKDSFKFFDAMKSQMQNDVVAPIHRDLTNRYSNRIHRIIEEAARREAIAQEKTGLIAKMESSVNGFLAITEAKT